MEYLVNRGVSMTNLTEIPIQLDKDGMEYINVSDSNFIAGQKTTSAGESLYSVRVYIWNQGVGFTKKYSYTLCFKSYIYCKLKSVAIGLVAILYFFLNCHI